MFSHFFFLVRIAKYLLIYNAKKHILVLFINSTFPLVLFFIFHFLIHYIIFLVLGMLYAYSFWFLYFSTSSFLNSMHGLLSIALFIYHNKLKL